MSAQLNFLLGQALEYIHRGNFDSAILLLKQIIKIKSNHAEALRLMAVVLAQQGKNESALEFIERSISADKRNGIAYSNKGNILLALNLYSEAILAHKLAIKYQPNYAEAYSNLGNVFQEILEYQNAIDCYMQAINLDKHNLNFKINLGNAYSRIQLFAEAAQIYTDVINLSPNNPSAHFYLAQLLLQVGNFQNGWLEYEWRWLAKENDSQYLKSTKQIWCGQEFEGCLFVWAEQGIGDQVLHSSMLTDLRRFPQKNWFLLTRNFCQYIQDHFQILNL